MARRGKKRNPPSTLAMIGLGLAASAGVGLLGYGTYKLIKKPKEPEALGSGSGEVYEYKIVKGDGRKWKARIRKASQTKWSWYQTRFSRARARTAAEEFIRRRGGTPVEVE